MSEVAVVGAGRMGRQIALQCALHGVSASLHDAIPEALSAAQAFSGEYLEGRVQKGRISSADRDAALGLVRFEADLAAAVREADFVIEAIVEEFSLKRDLFGELGRLCGPATILATNSSNMRASRLAEGVPHPERVINLHFFNPVLAMDLVEVVVHPAVTPQVEEAALGLCRRIGRTPVLLRQEIPGFIVNRIFRALTREAMNLLEGGYASIEDIDLAVKKGLGHPMGPFELMDMAGIDVTYLARLDEYGETGDEASRPNEVLARLYEEGSLGRKTGQGFYSYKDGERPPAVRP